MNSFEYGELFHKESFPKIIGTLTPHNPKIFREGTIKNRPVLIGLK